VHVRIRRVLGEVNYELLAKRGIKTKEGFDITAVVAAAIVAVRGMQDTADALTSEMDQRGLAHLTASTTVNRSAIHDTIIYYARATVFDGEVRTQGFGTDASKYAGEVVTHRGDRRLHLAYDGVDGAALPVTKAEYDVPRSSANIDFYV
jgi:hypothetical protein